MAKDNAPTNPIARFFRADPYRELFYTLADTIDSSVLVLSGTEPRVITCNHHFLLMTGYARKDLESLSPTDIFVGEVGQAALDTILGSRDESECSLQEVPFQTRSGEIVVVDLDAYPIVPGRSAILLTANPSSRRASELARKEIDSERLERLLEISDLILSGGEAALPTVLDLGRELIQASSVGLYRLSSSSPDYVLHGVLPAEFPEFLPSAALGSMPGSDSLGPWPAARVRTPEIGPRG